MIHGSAERSLVPTRLRHMYGKGSPIPSSARTTAAGGAAAHPSPSAAGNRWRRCRAALGYWSSAGSSVGRYPAQITCMRVMWPAPSVSR
jgi:hypothetical protein